MVTMEYGLIPSKLSLSDKTIQVPGMLTTSRPNNQKPKYTDSLIHHHLT